MKAVRIHEYGNAEVLRYEDAPEPTVGDDDVVIKVMGTSVNPVDWKIREGHLKGLITYEMPFIPGWDVSGVVHAVGPKASVFKVGDEVYSRPDIGRNGTYAEYVAVRESEVARKPKTISHLEAGSLPLAGITAWEAIVAVGKVAAGQRVLVHAASGGVGSLAVQIAKACGAFVIGTASGVNRELVESLGVDEFIDYQTQNLATATKDIDVVFDTIGGSTQDDSWSVMAKGGILISIVSQPSEEKAKEMGVRSSYLFIGPNVDALNELAALVDSGQLHPVIAAEFALEDVKLAHALSESGRAKGKIVLRVGSQPTQANV
jgi:NADPH:quinone reductase-like Zn-dependent oxidoreductase